MIELKFFVVVVFFSFFVVFAHTTLGWASSFDTEANVNLISWPSMLSFLYETKFPSLIRCHIFTNCNKKKEAAAAARGKVNHKKDNSNNSRELNACSRSGRYYCCPPHLYRLTHCYSPSHMVHFIMLFLASELYSYEQTHLRTPHTIPHTHTPWIACVNYCERIHTKIRHRTDASISSTTADSDTLQTVSGVRTRAARCICVNTCEHILEMSMWQRNGWNLKSEKKQSALAQTTHTHSDTLIYFDHWPHSKSVWKSKGGKTCSTIPKKQQPITTTTAATATVTAISIKIVRQEEERKTEKDATTTLLIR